MTSLTSPSDTIRLRARLPAASLAPAPPPVRLDPEPEAPVAVRVDAPSRRAQALTRLFDLSVSALALLALAPVMAAVAVAIVIESRGPVLYGSTRVGHRRPRFKAWKFRSMHPGADAQLERILADDPDARREYETFHKLKDDPRLTRVGAFIRRTSLDELPQLVNVLIGQMSIVGPRPKLPKDAEAFGPAMDVVMTVKPGLTGLWQVSGRNRLPVRDRVRLDVEYVRTRSLVGDLRICLETFAQLWRPGKHGAY
jgi:lipopolysaccharide/colanic/teichoic acid biosynthesis glycosyltransferase